MTATMEMGRLQPAARAELERLRLHARQQPFWDGRDDLARNALLRRRAAEASQLIGRPGHWGTEALEDMLHEANWAYHDHLQAIAAGRSGAALPVCATVPVLAALAASELVCKFCVTTWSQVLAIVREDDYAGQAWRTTNTDTITTPVVTGVWDDGSLVGSAILAPSVAATCTSGLLYADDIRVGEYLCSSETGMWLFAAILDRQFRASAVPRIPGETMEMLLERLAEGERHKGWGDPSDMLAVTASAVAHLSGKMLPEVEPC